MPYADTESTRRPLCTTMLHRFGARLRDSLLAMLIGCLVRPLRDAAAVDAHALAPVLHRGDVLLSDGSTRVALLVKRITRSPWSHVSLYVGPLEAGPDPRCIVEADMAAGVRSIRLSELQARKLLVLRPLDLDDGAKHRLAAWAVGRIGCAYDHAHAWQLAKRCLPLAARARHRSLPDVVAGSASRFICCSLLAHAFALVGLPVLPSSHGRDRPVAVQRDLTPDDFERAPAFVALDGSSGCKRFGLS